MKILFMAKAKWMQLLHYGRSSADCNNFYNPNMGGTADLFVP